MLFGRSTEGVAFFDGSGGKKSLQSVLEKETNPEILENLRNLVNGLDDVQDVYVMPEPEPVAAAPQAPKDDDEADLETPD